MLRISNSIAAALAAELKSKLDGGFLHIYSGPEPADCAAAAAGATLLVTISNNGDGVTGLTFAAPTTGVLNKTAAEPWSGDAINNGTASFYRFCKSGDDGLSAGSAADRIQGTVGSNPYTAQLVMPTTVTSGATVPVSAFSYNVPMTATA